MWHSTPAPTFFLRKCFFLSQLLIRIFEVKYSVKKGDYRKAFCTLPPLLKLNRASLPHPSELVLIRPDFFLPLTILRCLIVAFKHTTLELELVVESWIPPPIGAAPACTPARSVLGPFHAAGESVREKSIARSCGLKHESGRGRGETCV